MRILLFVLLLASSALAETPATRPAMVVGTLQSSLERVAEMKAAGVSLATVLIACDQWQPEQDHLDHHYIRGIEHDVQTFRKAGQLVQIDLGLQYPPEWVRKLPGARYVNQYGDAYIDER